MVDPTHNNTMNTDGERLQVDAIVHPRPNRPCFFPNKLIVYRDKTRRPDGWLLAEHQHQPPLYAANKNPGRKPRRDGSADIILYSGPTQKHSVLASARYLESHRDSYRATILAVPGSNGNNIEAKVLNFSKWNKMAWRFAIETDVTGHKDEFEWRTSGDPKISYLLGGRSLGYKLVRIRKPGDAECTGSGVWKSATDGGEVVAACSQSSTFFSKWWTVGFVGIGATGSLGRCWELMVVTTVLVLQDQQLKNDEDAS